MTFIDAPLSPLSPSSRRCSAHPPIAIESLRMTSVVGWRVRPDGRLWHAGLDLRGGEGTPVYAVRDGVCVLSVPDNSPGFGGYGVSVVLWHPQDGVFTHYAHLRARHVEAGASVRHGQLIAEVGRTSSGTWPTMGPHLHFEVRRQIAPEHRDALHARTLRVGGRTVVDGSPYPGPYPNPARDAQRFEHVWVNPLVYLASLGIQGPPLPWGQSGAAFALVRGSAADCGEHGELVARADAESPAAPSDLLSALRERERSSEAPQLAAVEPRPNPFDGLPFDAGTHDEDGPAVQDGLMSPEGPRDASPRAAIALGAVALGVLALAARAGGGR